MDLFPLVLFCPLETGLDRVGNDHGIVGQARNNAARGREIGTDLRRHALRSKRLFAERFIPRVDMDNERQSSQASGSFLEEAFKNCRVLRVWSAGL